MRWTHYLAILTLTAPGISYAIDILPKPSASANTIVVGQLKYDSSTDGLAVAEDYFTQYYEDGSTYTSSYALAQAGLIGNGFASASTYKVNYQAQANASFIYYFRLNSATGESAPIPVFTSYEASASATFGDFAQAEFTVAGKNSGQNVFTRSVSTCNPAVCTGDEDAIMTLGKDYFSIFSDQTYVVVLAATAWSTQGTAENPSTAYAFVDPYFGIDPSFQDAANYSFAFSEGVPNIAPSVPEPTTWVMMMIGFGVVGSTARRRRRMTLRIA